jgi:hypothetical protein
MDALDLLEQQHDAIVALFARLDAEGDSGERARLLGQLVREIDAHTRSEERHLHATVGASLSESDGARLRAGLHGDALLRFLARRLGDVRHVHQPLGPRLAIVRALFERHSNEQETWVFVRAKCDLQDEQLDALGLDLTRALQSFTESVAREVTANRRRTHGAPRRHGPDVRLRHPRPDDAPAPRRTRAARPATPRGLIH